MADSSSGNAVLTEAESSRIDWAVHFFRVAREDFLVAACKAKSFAMGRPAFLREVQATLAGSWDNDGKALKALFLAVQGATAGSAIYFSYGLGEAIAGVLATVGVTISATLITVAIVVVALIVLWISLPKLTAALASLSDIKLDFLNSSQ